uniref:RC124 n=1 Tax=Ruegeria sp. PR1b TaxID=185588 RepID=Q8KW66_9RHOB|nr:RC124 [Ruegeria sp. PR1b]
MVLAHHRGQPAFPAAVQLAKPAVSIPLGVGFPVFLPEQRQGHSGPAQLAMHMRPVRLGIGRGCIRRWSREQQRFQRRIRQIIRQRPRQTRPCCPADILADRRAPDTNAVAHFPGRQAACPQPQGFSDLPHRQSRHWVPPALQKSERLPAT